MTGRLENDAKRNEVINNLISKYPDYMKDYIKRFNSRTASTKENYVRCVIYFLNYVKENGRYDIDDLESLAKIKTSFINGYMESINHLAPVTRNNRLAAVRDFFEFMIDDELIVNNPCARVKPPKIEENIHVVSMTPEEIKHLKERVKDGSNDETDLQKARREKWRSRDFAIVTLGCATGLRVTSLTEINLEDINWTEKKITVVTKGNKTRDVFIGDNVIEALKNWIVDRNDIMRTDKKGCSALFVSDRKGRISTDTVSRILARGTADLDKHITPHKMRSSCATNIYNATGDIYLAQHVLGHSRTETTKRYAKMGSEKLASAATILDKMF